MMKSNMHRNSKEVQSKIRSSISISSYQQCVEELVMNALDSSATCISVRVNISTGFIQVVDNGSGISGTSMKLVGERYTSSKSPKLKRKRKHISCHGYRGEALASIAYLCRKLQITSKHVDIDDIDEVWCKTCEHGTWTLKESDEPRPTTGTTVTVSQLFYQSPVQNKFKTANRVMDDIIAKLRSLAVVHCSQASFSCKDARNGNIVLNTGRVRNMREAINCLYGGVYGKKLRAVSGTHDQLQVEGVISTEAFTSNRLRVVSLNKRILKPNRLHQAIEKELKNSLINIPGKERKGANERVVQQKKHYFYVINLVYDNDLYDGTIEPNKAAVEFEAWDKVIDSLSKLVRRFLFTNNLHKGTENKMLLDSVIDRPIVADLSISSDSQTGSGTVVLCDSNQQISEVKEDVVEKETDPKRVKSSVERRQSRSEKEIVKNKSFEILSERAVDNKELDVSAVESCQLKDVGKPEPMNSSQSMLKTAKWILHHFSKDTDVLDIGSPAPFELLIHAPSGGDSHFGSSSVDFFATPVFPKLDSSPRSPWPLVAIPTDAYGDSSNPWHNTPPLSTVHDKVHPHSAPGKMSQYALKRHIGSNSAGFSATPGKKKKLVHCQSSQPMKMHRQSNGKGFYPRGSPKLWSNNASRGLHTPPASSFIPLFSKQPLPSYVTPMRSSHILDFKEGDGLDIQPGSFTSLSPALQKIFAPLRNE